jgi:hypothetical protein
MVLREFNTIIFCWHRIDMEQYSSKNTEIGKKNPIIFQWKFVFCNPFGKFSCSWITEQEQQNFHRHWNSSCISFSTQGNHPNAEECIIHSVWLFHSYTATQQFFLQTLDECLALFYYNFYSDKFCFSISFIASWENGKNFWAFAEEKINSISIKTRRLHFSHKKGSWNYITWWIIDKLESITIHIQYSFVN